MSEKVPERSLELFKSGYCCAESVLLAVAESQGIQSDLIPRIASGFCSGISRTGGICGAVTGAIMGINLVTGRNSPTESNEHNYSLIRKLIDRFEMKHGPSDCPLLIGCDLSTEAGQRFFKQHHLIERCWLYVQSAAGMAVSIINEVSGSKTQ